MLVREIEGEPTISLANRTSSESTPSFAVASVAVSARNGVVNEWSILDEEIISGCSLAGFKRKLDRHLRDKRGSVSFLPLYR